MKCLTDHISAFLTAQGFSCTQLMRHGCEVISVTGPHLGRNKIILPLEVSADSLESAMNESAYIYESIRLSTSYDGEYPLIITEDRWHTQRELMKARLLAHLEVFSPIYARNCEVRRIDKAVAREFLEKNHSYGYAACRYCYGLFFKRHTGHIASAVILDDDTTSEKCTPGTLMAVATFSNARKWSKGYRIIRSYEWTRYASLPNVRLSGGMGRLLKAFIKEVQPDDVMSYADLEWSEGNVYKQLGFRFEGCKDPVMFHITEDWQRQAIKRGAASDIIASEANHVIASETWQSRYFQNFGSNKYRLKLTDYE